MTHQSKSYKKFVASAATATLVASALVPAASAATPAFTDVSKDYKEAVDYIVEHGFAKGTTDTTFGTAQNISRGDAAVMIANALKLDTANAKDAGFQDVNNRVEGAVNAIVEAGIASGRTSSQFDPAAYITRQEMAKMLANAYELEAETKAGFTDVNNNWIDYVSALKEAGITLGKTETTFAPTQNLTRGEFALFMFRAETMEVVLELKSATATDANTLSVTLSDDSAHTVTLDKALEANVATEVTFEIDGKEYTATVTWVVSKAEVVSVSAINATELQVEFSTPVDANSAKNAAAYVITLNDDKYGDTSGNIAYDGTVTSILDAGATENIYVSEDGKTVTFKLASANYLANGDKYSIDVKDSIKTKDGNSTIERFGDTQKVYSDLDAPKLVKTTLKGEDLDLEFNEPINITGDFKITVDGVDVTGDATVTTDALDYSVTVDLSGYSNQLKNGAHDVTIFNARDYVVNNANTGNRTAIINTTYTVVAAAVPKVDALKAKDFNSFDVEFNKVVTDGRIIVKRGNTVFYDQTFTGGTTKKQSIQLPVSALSPAGAQGLTWLYDDNANSTAISIEVQDYKDGTSLYGSKYNATLSLKRDDVKPKAVKSALTTTGFTVQLNREAEMTAGTGAINLAAGNLDTNKIKVTDKNGVVRTVTSAAVDAAGEITFILDGVDGTTIKAEDSAPFNVEFEADTITYETDAIKVVSPKDNSGSNDYSIGDFTNNLKNDAFTVKVAAEESSYKAVEAVSTALISENIITVTYKEKVGASATKLANYTLDGKALPAGTKISLDGSSKVATITLPDETYATAQERALGISKEVTTVKGEHVVGNIGTKEAYLSQLLPIADNVSPELKSAKFVNVAADNTTDEIELTFSEAVVNGNVTNGDNFIVIANDGTELAATVAAIPVAGSEKVVITLDNSKKVNTSQTIKVKVAEDTTAKPMVVTDMTTLAAKNKLKSGTVVTVAK